MDLVSVITPAYNSQDFILRPVQSLLRRSYQNWEMLIISDDQCDYQAILEKAEIKDSRIKFLSTGKIASGESNARNVGITNASGNFIAILDSDDEFKPTKLEQAVPQAKKFGVVSCAMEIVNIDGVKLRNVGDTISSGIIKTSDYKNINFSGDSMIVFDQKKIPVNYDTSLKCIPDLELMLKIFEYTDKIYHLSSPLHIYYKQPNSISNNSNAHIIFSEAKKILLQRLNNRYYNFIEEEAKKSVIDFLNKSLIAEKKFEEILQNNSNALFEDVFESLS